MTWTCCRLLTHRHSYAECTPGCCDRWKHSASQNPTFPQVGQGIAVLPAPHDMYMEADVKHACRCICATQK